MVKSAKDVEEILQRIGREWPDDSSLIESVMCAIKSTPIRPAISKGRRILVRSLVGLAASALIAIVALWTWDAMNDRQSLYAQVIGSVQKARTLHEIQYVQPKDGGEPVKASESWYERDVGFREEGFGLICVGDEQTMWNYAKDRNVATRSLSPGIAKAPASILEQIDRIAQQLQSEYTRDSQDDRTINGEPCQAYRLTKLDRYTDPKLKSGQIRIVVYLNAQSRPSRSENRWKEGDQWKTKSFITFEYDKPIDRALFEPNFGKDVKMVDADAVFDELTSLKSAIHVEEHLGLIFAFHRVKRFENGGVMIMSSVRGTEETLKKFPLIARLLD